MRRTDVIFVVATTLFLPVAQAAPPVFKELDRSQQREVLEGRQVVVTKDIVGEPWPQVTVYHYVPAEPEEVAAVFFDYKMAREFIPNVVKSEISNVVSPSEMDVDYGVDIPILPDEFYTARNRLRALGGNCYVIDWKLLKALQTKASVGEFRVEPVGRGALIRYRNLTTPGSKIAILLRGQALAQIKETVAAIAGEVKRQKTEEPAALARRVAALKAATKEETEP